MVKGTITYTDQSRSDWEKEFDKRFGCSEIEYWEFSVNELKDFIRFLLQQVYTERSRSARQEGIEEAKKNVGQLRQWLNERNSKELITNKEIEYWLFDELKKKE